MNLTNCPICERELLTRLEMGVSQICPNNCYETEKYQGFTNHCFIQPDKPEKVKITLYARDQELESKKRIIQQIIDYWKYNDRYLQEIMEN